MSSSRSDVVAQFVRVSVFLCFRVFCFMNFFYFLLLLVLPKGKQSKLLLKPTEVELGLQVGETMPFLELLIAAKNHLRKKYHKFIEAKLTYGTK